MPYQLQKMSSWKKKTTENEIKRPVLLHLFIYLVFQLYFQTKKQELVSLASCMTSHKEKMYNNSLIWLAHVMQKKIKDLFPRKIAEWVNFEYICKFNGWIEFPYQDKDTRSSPPLQVLFLILCSVWYMLW